MPMSPNAKPPVHSPSAIASHWLDRQLAPVLAAVRRRLRRHVIATSTATAFASGIGAFSVASLANTDAWHLPGAVGAAALAAATALAGAAALYPVLRQRERWLLRAVATNTHDNIDLLAVLGKLTELRSGETAGHNLRVTLYTLLFAEALELQPTEIVRTVKGALLHDVGKLAVPDRILGKPGRLTADERVEMNKHVRFGLEIIGQSHVLHDAALVVGAHHERYDGQGYPLGLKGGAIPHEARLFALVDVFDALTSPRVYKPAFSVEDALATMAAGRGSHFDPALFDRFADLAPDFARRLPRDEPALAALLMERLFPYFELFVLGRAMPAAMMAQPAPTVAGKP